jgi:hypothetical protein
MRLFLLGAFWQVFYFRNKIELLTVLIMGASNLLLNKKGHER